MSKNTKRFPRILFAWLFAFACAAGIFFLSSQNGEQSAMLSSGTMLPFARLMYALFGEAGHNVFRKFAHFFAYCLLMFFTYHAFYQTRTEDRLSPFWPFTVCVLYACSDELHQYSVPDRACRLFDVGVDTLGCLVGGLCFYLVIRLIRYIQSRKRKETKL